MKYRPEIDGLRAIAVVSVILFHSGYTFLAGGYFGVDIFFVISGYLITTIISSEIAADKFSLRNFYERRARRILPALFLVVLCCIPFAWLFLLPYEMKDFAESIFTVATFSSNILFWSESGYFARASETKPLLHTWSLAIEEQYYLVFPLFLLLLNRFRRISTFYVLIGLTFASLIYAQVKFQSDPSGAFFLILPRCWELLVGSIAALVHIKFGRHLFRSSIRSGLSFLGFFFILIGVFGVIEPSENWNFVPIIPVIGAFLILIFAQKDNGVGHILGLGMFVGIGLISYSSYLWHQPILAFSRILGGDEVTLKFAPLLILATFIFAYLSWRFIEGPFRDNKIVSPAKFSFFTIPIFFLFLIFGVIGNVYEGFSHRLTSTSFDFKGDIGHQGYFNKVFKEYSVCKPVVVAQSAQKWGDYFRCAQSKTLKESNVILIGDSHAEHLFLGIAEELSDDNVVYYSKDAFASVYEPEFAEIFEVLENAKSTELIVLSMHWVKKVKAIPSDKSFQENIEDTLNFFVRNSDNVVLLDDVPSFPFSPSECINSLPLRAAADCEIGFDQFEEQKATYSGTLREIAESIEKVEYISLDKLFCDDNFCKMDIDGALLYRDDDHLNILGSRKVGKFLAPKLNALRDSVVTE